MANIEQKIIIILNTFWNTYCSAHVRQSKQIRNITPSIFQFYFVPRNLPLTISSHEITDAFGMVCMRLVCR